MSSSILALRNHLEMLQQTFANALTSNSPMAAQPPHIQLPLRMHQLTAMEAMRTKEQTLHTGWQIPGTQETLFSNYAFLGDRVGVGKTLMVLGHISQMTTQPPFTPNTLSNLHPRSSASFFSILPSPTPTTLFSSLVIVPHTIFRQWQSSIEQHTTLTAHFLKTQRDLDKDSLLNQLRDSHLTLISNTLLPLFLNSLRARQVSQPTWVRVIYDEADNLKIPVTCPVPQALFTWYITATFQNFLFANEYMHSYHLQQLNPELLQDLHPEVQEVVQNHIDNHPHITFFHTQSQGFFQEKLRNTHPLRSHLIVQNSRDFLHQSVQLPVLQRQIIRCRALNSQQILESVIPPETEAMLHAGDVQGALRSLGVSTETHLTLVDVVTDFHKKELDRMKRLYEFKKHETYSTPQAKQQALDNMEHKIQTQEANLLLLKTRIQDATRDNCSICYELPQESVLVPCCSRVFCGSCLLSWLLRQNSCPLCRASISPDRLIRIDKTKDITNSPFTQMPTLQTKVDALCSLFHNNPQGKFLLFSRYDFPMETIRSRLPPEQRIAEIQGNKDVIAHLLRDFEDGLIQCLFMNSKSAAAGIHIPSATHVVLYHKMGAEEEKQILGRAYRLGRTEPLSFIQLLHERE